jgi:two-component system sensor histidine kinase HydH
MVSNARHPADEAPPFDLVRWFALVSAFAILGLASATAWSLQRFMTENALARDVDTMVLFLNSIVRDEHAEGYFLGNAAVRDTTSVGTFFYHLSNMPGVLRANAYALDRRIIWSSSGGLAGRTELGNEELEKAFSGTPIVESGHVGRDVKPEHAGLASEGTFFVENYLPIWATAGPPRVIGVVEVYRTPERLAEAIERGRLLVVAGAITSGLLLYLALFWLIARAARLIEAQQRELISTRMLAASGEVASAVAHGLRNPLAAIRSAADLSVDGSEEERRRLLGEIIADADRLEEWVRQYLNYARAEAIEPAALPLGATVQRCLAQIAAQCRQRGVEVAADLPPDLPNCAGEPLLLDQVVASLLSNAVEAMPHGGRLTVAARPAGDMRVLLRIADSGPGMTAAELKEAFVPFHSGKPGGLGLGLPLARQIAQRLGGSLDLDSVPGIGTEARLTLLEAPA